MKKETYLLIFSVLSTSLFAQVGINTVTPQSTLQVLGKPSTVSSLDGIIAPSITGDQLKAKTYTSAQDGAIQYVTAAAALANRTGQAVNIDSPGYYYFSGSDNAWYRLQVASKNWVFDNAYDIAATSNIDATVSSNTIVNNVDLGLSLTVTIPANSSVKVIVNYSTPVGISVPAVSPGGYMGIRFLKNGSEADTGSRKVSISALNNTGAFIMSTVGASYIENITNSGAETTITYTLNGYIEKTSGSGSTTFRFNMWAASGANFNWGRGTMNAQVFKKPL